MEDIVDLDLEQVETVLKVGLSLIMEGKQEGEKGWETQERERTSFSQEAQVTISTRHPSFWNDSYTLYWHHVI